MPLGGNMQNDMMTYFNEISKNVSNSVAQLVELNTRVMNEALERQFELGNVFFDESKKQVELLSASKDPKELVEIQSKFAEEYTTLFVEAAKENIAIAQKTSDEYTAWFENNATLSTQAPKKAPARKKAA